MHKILSILLLMAFALPGLTPLLAKSSPDEANLPACCRRNGKHHCMMSRAERSKMLSNKPQFTSIPEQCPYCPAVPAIVHQPNVLGVPSGQITFAGLVGQSAVVAQVKAKRRISRDRSHQKRGPPSSKLS